MTSYETINRFGSAVHTDSLIKTICSTKGTVKLLHHKWSCHTEKCLGYICTVGRYHTTTTLVRVVLGDINNWTVNTHLISSADSRLAPSQWETALLCNDVSHWLGAIFESALISPTYINSLSPFFPADILSCTVDSIMNPSFPQSFLPPYHWAGSAGSAWWISIQPVSVGTIDLSPGLSHLSWGEKVTRLHHHTTQGHSTCCLHLMISWAPSSSGPFY